MDDDRNGRDFGNDSFRVAGQGVQGHQVLTSREGPRPPTPRGRHMDVTTSYPDGADAFQGNRYREGGPSLQVGGRPVDGHQVLRPRGPPRRMGRGPHMDVTTSDPHFVRTDRRGGGQSAGPGPGPGAGPPYYEDDREYEAFGMDGGGGGPQDRVYRGGAGVRPDTQDLQGRGRMPMQNEEWNRYRNVREDSTPFRSSRRMDGYEDDDVPHFMATGEEVGLPVNVNIGGGGGGEFDRDRDGREGMGRRMPPPSRGGRRGDRMEEEMRGANRESLREREWRELQARNDRKRGRSLRPPGSSSQDLRGLGRMMPMRGDDWDDMAYPERRGPGPGPGGFRGDGPGRRYPQDELADDFAVRRPESRRGRDFDRRRDDYGDGDDLDGDYVREGPHMVRSGLPSYRDEERRGGRFEGGGGGGGGGGRDDFMEDDRYFRRESRELYNRSRPPRRDRRGSVGGPMSEDLIGVDSEYAASRQSWQAGTSMDVI
jgi:hypothetical protein